MKVLATFYLKESIYVLDDRSETSAVDQDFYLTKDLEDAVNWSKSTTAKPAILIFKVVDCIDHNRKLTLSENDRQWHEMVTSFRMDNITARKEESLVRAYDFIEGPVAMVTRRETFSEVVFVPKPSSYQMCLISDDFADKFQKTLTRFCFTASLNTDCIELFSSHFQLK